MIVLGVRFSSGRSARIFSSPILVNVSYESFADTGRMHAHAASNPGIHADESVGLDLFDIYGFGPIENGEVAGEIRLLHEMPHDLVAQPRAHRFR